MDCSRWKALPSGRRRLRRTTTVSPYFFLLRAANPTRRLTGETLKLSVASKLAATFQEYHRSKHSANRTHNPKQPQTNNITTSLRLATPTTKHNVENLLALLKSDRLQQNSQTTYPTSEPEHQILPEISS
jgi:hypothetical protein